MLRPPLSAPTPDLIERIAGYRIIEVGAGEGLWVKALRLSGVDIIGIDRSQAAIGLCLDLAQGNSTHLTLLHDDALDLLPSMTTMMESVKLIDQADTLIYADPPYLAETRKGGDLYQFEMSDTVHERLLHLLVGLPSMVMISGYRAPLYDKMLAGFHRVDYEAQTRRGPAAESLWMNFAPPVALHDYSHLGDDYRERERIRRKKARWAAKIARMDRQERLAIMDVLTSASSGERHHG